MKFNNPIERFKKLFNKNEEQVSKTPEKLSENQLERLRDQTMRAARKGVMYLMMVSPFAAAAAESGPDLKMSENKNSISNKEWSFDATDRFHTRDTSGVEKFNWWSLLSAAQVEVGSETKFINKTDMSVPYSYSRNFDKGEALTPAERDSVTEHIVQELQKQFLENIDFWGFGNGITTEEVYNYKHGINKIPHSIASKIVIDSITITAQASPEGRTANSLLPGNIDAENLKLAGYRGEDIAPYVKMALTRIGIDPSTIKSIKTEEVQFSQNEMNTLFELASQGCYDENGTVLQNIHAMIKQYNRHTLKDSSVVKQLDQILATKRGIEITIHSHGKESSKTVIPLPIGLILLGGLGAGAAAWGLSKVDWERFSRGGGGTRIPAGGFRTVETVPPVVPVDPIEPEPEAEKGPRQIFSELTYQKGKVERGDQNFHNIYRSALETEGLTAKDRKIISETVFAEEIYDFLKEESAIDNGLRYYDIIKLARQLRESARYTKDDEIKEILAEEVLTQWQNYDRKIRGGIKDGELKDLPRERTMDYRHDPKKVIWAIEAAAHLFELGGTKTNEELEALLRSKVDAIEDERVERGNSRYRNINSVGYQEPFNGLDGIEFKKADQKLTITSSISEEEKKRLEAEAKATKKAAKKVPAPKKAAAAKKTAVKKVAAKKTIKLTATSPSVSKTVPAAVVESNNPAPIQAQSEKYEPIYGSEENDDILRAAFSGAPENLPLEAEVSAPAARTESPAREALLAQIRGIDTQLRALETRMESTIREGGRVNAVIEQDFNNLETQKKAIMATLDKTA